MSARLGLEIDERFIRAVRIEGWLRPAVSAMEVEWERDRLGDAVEAIRGQLGPAARVAIAIDHSLLHTKQVQLPPLPTAERRNIIRLEPERFFPVQAEELTVSVRERDNLVFALPEGTLVDWVAELAALGNVDLIEPGPVALVRALRRARLQHATILAEHRSSVGVVLVRGGVLASVRTVRGSLADAASALAGDVVNGEGEDEGEVYLEPWDEERARVLAPMFPAAHVLPLPGAGTLGPAYLTAYGAALGIGGGLEEALVPDALARQIVHRRRRDVALAAVSCVAALLLGLASLDGSRSRTEHELAMRIDSLRPRADSAAVLQTQAQALMSRDRAVAELEAGRPAPLQSLLSISQALPKDAFVLTLRGTNGEWQADGYAHDAARLVPLFERAPGFSQTHFLTATTSATVGNRTYESFSLAFRVAPTP